MTPDPKRSPIAALAQLWREDAKKLREQAEKFEAVRASAIRNANDYDARAEELEAAIAAQVEVFEAVVKRELEAGDG